MIRVDRGLPDRDGAEGLAALEQHALTAMRTLRAQTGADPSADHIEAYDYRIAGRLLWKRQGYLCAYCESMEQRKRNDVEHFRPKVRAQRGPTHPATRGYWWLAWRWENLLFACRNCNQAHSDLEGARGKLDRFPLASHSGVLVPEQDPYGADAGVETPLLIDPSRESGLDHIEFRSVTLPGGATQWRPYPRNGSVRGKATIFVLALDRDDLLELYNQHVADVVRPRVVAFRERSARSTPGDRRASWERVEWDLLRRGRPFAALAFDVLVALVPNTELAADGIARRRPPL